MIYTITYLEAMNDWLYPQIRAGEVYGGVDVGPPSGLGSVSESAASRKSHCFMEKLIINGNFPYIKLPWGYVGVSPTEKGATCQVVDDLIWFSDWEAASEAKPQLLDLARGSSNLTMPRNGTFMPD